MTLWLAGGGRKEEVRDIGRVMNTMHLGAWGEQGQHLTPTTQLSRDQLRAVHTRCWQFTQSSRMRNWLILQKILFLSCLFNHSYIMLCYCSTNAKTIAICQIIIFFCCGCQFLLLPLPLDPNLHNYISVIIQAFPRLQIIIIWIHTMCCDDTKYTTTVGSRFCLYSKCNLHSFFM